MRVLLPIVFLFLAGTVATAQMNTYQYQSEEPSYSADVSLTQGLGAFSTSVPSGDGIIGSKTYNTRYESNTMQIGLNGNILENLKYRAGISFMKRQYSIGDESYSVSGLSDMGGSLWGLTTFDTFILDYGVATTLSVAPARFERVTTAEGPSELPKWGNNYSGYNSYRAFVGSNFAVGPVDGGVRGNLTLYQARVSQNSELNGIDLSDRTGVGAEAFMEVPMYKKARVGVSMGFESPTFNTFANAEEMNSGYSSIYGKYKYDAETSFLLGIVSQVKNVFYQADSTDLTLGVARSL